MTDFIKDYTTVEEVLCDIFRHELSLDVSQCLPRYAYSPPSDNRLYISVALLSSRATSYVVDQKYDNNQNVYIETKTIYKNSIFSINIYSLMDNTTQIAEALIRRSELELAILSSYARMMMDIYRISIPQLSLSFTNNTELAPGSQNVLYRYTASLAVNHSIVKINNSDYFDTFTTDTPLIEN